MKSLLFSLLILANTIYANVNYIEIYRQNGINAVENIINETMTKKSYWYSYLSNIDVSNGYYESIQYILLCSKSLNDLHIYKYKDNLNHLIFQSDVITGELNGQKLIEGDLKTPIGAYELLQKLNKVDPFYGPLALVTSYPNHFDKSYGKTGSGIWIHGFPQYEQRDPYTKGCIAMNNNNLIKLSNTIDLKKSILIIRNEKEKIDVTKNEISSLLSQLFSWKNAWQNNNFDKYISFYSRTFKKANKTNIFAFTSYKKRLFDRNEKKVIQFSKINIIPYPNDLNKNMFKITLFENYKTKRYKFIGIKDIYVELLNGKMKIINEG